MSLLKTKAAFREGKLSKPDYIREMHRDHRVIFECAELMKGTDISKVEVTDGEVIMTVRATGIRMVCDPDDQRIAPIEILNFDGYEETDSKMMARLFAAGGILFDIGANFGWYSLALSQQIPDLTVHAFEPIPKTFGYLRRNLELNHATRVHAHDFGFSAKEEDMTFYFYPEGSGNASLANLSDRADVQKVTCKILKLDSFVQANQHRIDYIKCDVEGAELFVFQGGIETLRTQKPVVFTEMLRKWSAKFNYHPNEIIDLFRGLGYRCFTAQGSQLAEFSRMDEQTLETNFFFLHAEKHIALIARHTA